MVRRFVFAWLICRDPSRALETCHQPHMVAEANSAIYGTRERNVTATGKERSLKFSELTRARECHPSYFPSQKD